MAGRAARARGAPGVHLEGVRQGCIFGGASGGGGGFLIWFFYGWFLGVGGDFVDFGEIWGRRVENGSGAKNAFFAVFENPGRGSEG